MKVIHEWGLAWSFPLQQKNIEWDSLSKQYFLCFWYKVVEKPVLETYLCDPGFGVTLPYNRKRAFGNVFSGLMGCLNDKLREASISDHQKHCHQTAELVCCLRIDFTCSIILSLLFRIVPMVEWFILLYIRMCDIYHLFTPLHFLIIFTFVSIVITWHFSVVWVTSLLLLHLLSDMLVWNKDAVLLHSIQYCTVQCKTKQNKTQSLKQDAHMWECMPDVWTNMQLEMQMVNIKVRLSIFFASKGWEALYSQRKQDQEMTVAQIVNCLLQNSDLNWRK